MEPEPINGTKRNSTYQGSYSRPVERWPSKKSSSKDRHGMVYPDSFRDTSIRTVMPDSISDSGNHSPVSDGGLLSSNTTVSPYSTIRSRPSDHESRRKPSPYHSEDDIPVETKTLRMRSRTTTLDDQRSEISPNSFLLRRNRLGFLNTTPSPNSKPSDESISSIGFPSIIQSPTAWGQIGIRQRLTKPPPGGTTSTVRNPAAFALPLSNADSAKILQLMKTTCGRMHGILSFRTAANASWTSGYCAINVATGSLIYQAKGEPAAAKTLIPDLRGCHVRTLFDSELQSTYLTVSTFSSGLGIQLKPHVNETFDSWLAALLCWQPIRPKGVQNKRTKPQSVAIGDRRLADRRRNSESTVQREAAIIKVGKMLLWERLASGTVPQSGRRVSTYRQQRALSSSWQKVSCTLQENGDFKLYTESDVTLIHRIVLSSLSRSAIQHLESSVLDDEYCIAIYPRYATHSISESTSNPIFLSLESRVLFEVWFVLLRAFTIPELYGPESAASEDLNRSQSLANSGPPPTADMFRIERLLSLRITEAKLKSAKVDDAFKNKKQSKAQTTHPGIPMISDYYTEVLLDGEIRAKTAVKHKTATPFWREDFTFADLPPVLSNATVVVKTLNPAQKDWTLIAHGSYSLDSDLNPLNILSDLEVSSHDATCGRIDLRLDELEPGVDMEKWWSILDDRDQVVGEMFMKVRLEETVILMSHEYEPMSQLLHSFPNNLTVNMAHILPLELNQLSEILLNIYQVSGQAVDWISALVEDEIDGIHADSSVSRLRYTSRIHSNDSRDSGQDREALVRDLGRSATIEANLLFRGNSLLTKALDLHMRRLGKDYLQETIGERLRDVDENDLDCEVDPVRAQRPEDIEHNWRNLIILTSHFWKSISKSASRCPAELRLIFRHIRACAEDRYGDFLRSVTYSSVSGFLFLRFFCPAILNPKLFGLLKEHPRPRAQRTLTLIAKALQGLANMSTFGNKEPWMEPMNKFLIGNRSDFKEFVDAICSIPAERPTRTVSPSYATPIQILSRLPPTSREGFPSLPFLIDHARSFAALTTLWLEAAPVRMAELSETGPYVTKFHNLALELQQRTKDCLSKAEQAERPNGNLEVKWEELVESIERSVTFYDENTSKATTPVTETPLTAPAAITGGHRNSICYFSRRPSFPRRSTDNSADVDDDTPPISPFAAWDPSRSAFSMPVSSDRHEPINNSKSSSAYSLESSECPKSHQSSASRETSSKYRLFDFVPGPSRRKAKDRDGSQQHSRENPKNETR